MTPILTAFRDAYFSCHAQFCRDPDCFEVSTKLIPAIQKEWMVSATFFGDTAEPFEEGESLTEIFGVEVAYNNLIPVNFVVIVVDTPYGVPIRVATPIEGLSQRTPTEVVDEMLKELQA